MEGGGEGSKVGTAYTGGYKGVRAVRPESVAGGGWFDVLWNLECPAGLSQREICAHLNEGNLAQFRRSADKIPHGGLVELFQTGVPKAVVCFNMPVGLYI